ncbi:TolC family protein [Gramella sp. KN1008]|uniref:TolC family protein n=1 Tax=Gramella sp. KN1008 TaxID=2529298 RepID=UPI00103C9628|nr:TolC family protein [Gramella sp. KN1008]TBW26994.1 TolC family protein [Gramella sp. KN1008]
MKKTPLSTGILCLLFIFIINPSAAQQLDPVLKDLIKKGLGKSHKVNVYDLEAEKAKIDQKLAKSVFIPKLSLNGSYTRLNDDITFDEDTQNLLMATQKLLIKEAAGLPFNAPFPENIPLQQASNLQDRNILKSSVDIDWVLFSGFEATNALKAAKHKEASVTYAGLAEEDRIALKIIETYDQLALINASEKVLSISEDYLQEQEDFVTSAIKNGLATPISRKKIELARQQLKAKELEFNHKKTMLIEVLQQLTGVNRDELELLQPQLATIMMNSTQDSEKRNEIMALEEAEKATEYKAKMARSKFIPKIALKGHYEFLEDDLSLFDPQWYVGAGVQWNIFDGNESRLKSQQSKLESKKYREKIEEGEEMIALSQMKAQLSYEAAVQNAEIAKKEIELAEATYEMLDKKYHNDLASINEVLDALKDVEKAKFQLQQSYFDQRRATTALLHAKGLLNY